MQRWYDGNGNTIIENFNTPQQKAFGYDARNRMISFWANSGASAAYGVNAMGERVSKDVSSSGGTPARKLTVFAYDQGGPLLSEGAATWDSAANAWGAVGSYTDYIYMDGMPVGMVFGGNLYFIEADHLGTPRRVVDKSNKAVWSLQSARDPFGEGAPSDDVGKKGGQS